MVQQPRTDWPTVPISNFVTLSAEVYEQRFRSGKLHTKSPVISSQEILVLLYRPTERFALGLNLRPVVWKSVAQQLGHWACVDLCLHHKVILDYINMSAYKPNYRHLREFLMFCFNMKKSAAEAHRMLSNTYAEATISERTCREWFQRFKNGDFDVEDQHGIWWDQLDVMYYELLKPTETITGDRYRTQLLNHKCIISFFFCNKASNFGKKRRKQSCTPNNNSY
ncbi:uncharacterized protein TNCV_2155151 [Trichonephila clavipes]|nr:uncharacterized protein TNCV_2155151 [Trichonephila clavipes]